MQNFNQLLIEDNTMQAIVEFRENKDAPVKVYLNVSGNNPGRIYSIVKQYRDYKGYQFSHIYFEQHQEGLAQLTNYKGTSYVK